ncbi:hypothetical protein JCM3775_001791 [Rhodotorula graminis]
MKAATELIVSLSTVFGTIFVALALAGARFAFRRSRKARAVPVDPTYEETKVTLVGAGAARVGEQDKQGAERWFAGSWGVTPVASEGPGGTAQYLGGWWGLDAPSNAGYPRTSSLTHTEDDQQSTRSTATSGMRESHFSRASRASRRADKLARAASAASSKAAGDDVRKKEKKKPRVSKTTEFGAFEQDAGVEVDEEEDRAREKEALVRQ